MLKGHLRRVIYQQVYKYTKITAVTVTVVSSNCSNCNCSKVEGVGGHRGGDREAGIIRCLRERESERARVRESE